MLLENFGGWVRIHPGIPACVVCCHVLFTLCCVFLLETPVAILLPLHLHGGGLRAPCIRT